MSIRARSRGHATAATHTVTLGVRSACVAAVAALLVTACSGSGTSSGSDGGGGTDGSTPAVGLSVAPPTESATSEAPQSRSSGAAIKVASLPIGGDVDGDTALRCGHVNWLGPTPIPHGVSVVITGVSVQPSGTFEIGGAGCSSDIAGPTCTTSWSWTWKTATTECLVPLTQVVEGDADQAVTLVVSGSVKCVVRSACDAFTQLGGSQILFNPLPGVVDTGPAGSPPGAPPSSVTSPAGPPSGAGESS